MSEKQKRKHKRTQKPTEKQPSPFNHMIRWGVLTAYVLIWGMYVLFMQTDFTVTLFDVIMLFVIASPYWALLGLLPGVTMGLFTGAVIEIFVRDAGRVTGNDAVQSTQKKAAGVVFLVTSLMTFLLVSALVSGLGLSEGLSWLYIFGFALFAGGMMAFGSHRYFVKSYPWLVQKYRVAEKAKRASQAEVNRLESDNYLETSDNDTMQLHDLEADMKANQR